MNSDKGVVALRMSNSELPVTVDPYKLVERGAHLEGVLPLSRLTRGRDLLVSDRGAVSASFDFGRDDENRRVVSGHLEARIQVICQRCLEPMEEHVQSDFELAIVSDDEGASQVPGHYEPVETDRNDSLRLRDLVEDELLLAMAPFPMHPEGECEAATGADPSPREIPVPKSEKDRKNPFRVLEGLLDSKKDDSSRH